LPERKSLKLAPTTSRKNGNIVVTLEGPLALPEEPVGAEEDEASNVGGAWLAKAVFSYFILIKLSFSPLRIEQKSD
jgi:hypothetical protein